MTWFIRACLPQVGLDKPDRYGQALSTNVDQAHSLKNFTTDFTDNTDTE